LQERLGGQKAGGTKSVMEKVPQIVSERLRAAAQTNHAAADHLDADVLTAFAEKSLPEAERTPVMDHLARCGDCRDVLALALPASESLEPMAEASRASFSHSSVSRGSWLSWPVLRWGFAAAGLAVIATFGVMQYQRSSRPETESRAKAAGPNAPAAQASNVAGPEALSTSTVDASRDRLTGPNPTATTPVAKQRAADLSAGNQEKKAVDVPAPQVAGSQSQIGEPSMASSETAPRGMVRRVPTPRAALPGGNMGGTTASGTTTANAAFGPKMPAQWQQNAANNVNGMSSQTALQNAGSAATDKTALVSGAAQTVEVSGSVGGPEPSEESKNLQLLAANDAAPKVEDKDVESLRKAKPAQEGQNQPEGNTVSRSVGGPPYAAAVMPKWMISPTGRLQRSIDRGNTWQDVDVTVSSGTAAAYGFMAAPVSAKQAAKSPAPVFRTVTANGAEVWAGGTAGMLYHSTDGIHWTRVVPMANGNALTEDIVRVEFSDAQHGLVTTSSATWTTADGGQSWRKP
jgi:hypothetical protein